jgi:3'(2'), 5'-bisphosphate nucleotidase
MTSLLPPLITIAREAGSLILEGRRAHLMGNPFSIEIKENGTKVTSIDLASNDFLIDALTSLTPGVPIISEETPVDPQYRKESTVWIIDPLDGTTSFIEGRNDFSVLLCLVDQKRPILSVMYFPELDLLASAEREKGAFLNGMPLFRAPSPFHGFKESRVILRGLTSPDSLSVYQSPIDSGLALLKVAQGEADAFLLKMVTHQEWDIAAPALILQESGCIISSEKGEPLEFNKDPRPWSTTVTSSKEAHKEALLFLEKCS